MKQLGIEGIPNLLSDEDKDRVVQQIAKSRKEDKGKAIGNIEEVIVRPDA